MYYDKIDNNNIINYMLYKHSIEIFHKSDFEYLIYDERVVE